VKHNYLVLSIGTIIFSSILLFFSCKKINSATELGDDLIPPIDNITTFDTTLDVIVTNDSFTLANDSTRYGANLFNASYTQYLGYINNDPFFGKSNAKLYLQLKPELFNRYPFANRNDSLFIDSVVLVLNYLETWGDTTVPQTVNVYEIAQASNFDADSVYIIRENNIANAGLLGSRTFRPYELNDSVKAYKDTTANQLRIRLSDAFGQRLLNYDTTTTRGYENAYSTDSAFNSKFKGFSLESTSGNAVVGFNLNGANTKLAIYYRYYKNGISNIDTTVTDFKFTSLSASANHVTRDYAGSAFAASVGGTGSDDVVYIQNTPGSYATIKIPGLANLNNRVVHRAELIMEQIYDISDSMFSPQTYLYLDGYDATESKYRTIPYDVIYNPSDGSINLNAFGGLPYVTRDPAGNTIRSWRFNLSRYVQHVVNGTEPVFDYFRLHSPLYTFNYYRASPQANLTNVTILANPNIARGRVRLHGNNGAIPATNPQRMRLRIVYSKI